MPGNKEAISRRAWAEYDEPQQLQRLLDKGDLSRDFAMQFAIGDALSRLEVHCPGEQSKKALKRIVGRMKQTQPKQRYPSLSDAADALFTLLNRLPLVSTNSYGPLGPQDLATPPGKPAPLPINGTAMATDLDEPQPNPRPRVPQQPQPQRTSLMPWLYAAAAMGAVVGTAWPLPW